MYKVDGIKLREVAKAVGETVGDDVGFVVIVFEKDQSKENTMTQYISNVEKSGLIKIVAELLTRLCRRNTFEPLTNN